MTEEKITPLEFNIKLIADYAEGVVTLVHNLDEVVAKEVKDEVPSTNISNIGGTLLGFFTFLQVASQDQIDECTSIINTAFAEARKNISIN